MTSLKTNNMAGLFQIGAAGRLTNWLLAALLISLPFSEWKFIGLPLHGRPLLIDTDQYLSVSAFDVVFTFLAITSLPILWNWARARKYLNAVLIHWLVGLILVAIVWNVLQPTLPLLTARTRNIVDTRILLYCLCIAVVLGVLVSELPLKTLLKSLSAFFYLILIGFSVLSYLALKEFTYFHLHYPFTNPASISFPFPNQNYAAPFITLALLAMLGVGATTGNRALLLLAPSVLIPSALLTGSRSNIVLLTVACAVSFAAYVWFWTNCRKQNQPRFPSPMIQIGGLALAAVLILPNSEWLTIQRSLSIFADIVNKPGVVVTAQTGSPRAEMWSRSMSSVAGQSGNNISNRQHSSKYSLALVTVDNGCKTVSKIIPGLQTGRNYRIVLEIARSSKGDPIASLTAWNEGVAAKPIGAIGSPWTGVALPNLYLFAADSDAKFVIAQGTLSNFNLIRNGDAIGYNPLSHSGVLVNQTPFNGMAGPAISVIEAQTIKFTADHARLEGYVASKGGGYDEGNAVRLAYELNMEKSSHSIPLDAPAMFYVGFTDRAAHNRPDSWGTVVNGIFVQHARELLPWEPSMRSSIQATRLESLLRNGDLNAASPIAAIIDENKKIKCGVGGVNNLAKLWTPEIDKSAVLSMGANAYGSFTISRGTTQDFNSTDASWSSELHMAQGGSTHNVYVDWYHYVGKTASIAFVLFLGALLFPLLLIAWRHRNSSYWPLFVAVALQVFVIFATMYAQPYWWLRYFWAIFGLAAGLMIHPEIASHIRPDRMPRQNCCE